MAMGIDDLELDIADREAQRELNMANRKSEQLGKIGQMVAGNVETGLGAAEDVAKLEESKRMKGEWDKMTANGEQSITALAGELGLEPSEYVKIYQAQRNPQTGRTDPQVMLNIMKTMKQASAEKAFQAEDSKFQSLLSGFEGEMTSDTENEFIKAAGQGSERFVKKNLPVAKAFIQGKKDSATKKATASAALRDSDPREKLSFQGKLLNEHGEIQPTVQQDRTAREKVQRALVFGSKGGQRVLGTSINKQVAIQDALDTLEGTGKDGYKATKQIGQELAAIIAQVLSAGGAVTEAQMNAVFPSSLQGDLGNMAQHITGEAVDSLPEGLLNQLRKMLEREQTFWNKRISNINTSLAGTLGDIFKTKSWVKRDGKWELTRTRKKMQKDFAAWLLNQTESQEDVLGAKAGLFDLIATDEDKERWKKEASEADVTLKEGFNLKDLYDVQVNQGGTPAPSKTVKPKKAASKPTMRWNPDTKKLEAI